MALFGVAPTVMRPTALALNVPVASFTSFRYLRAGLFRWRTVWPFLLGAVPLAFVGGAIQLLGAIVGTTFGIRFASPMILKALGLVLVIAGLKLIGVY
jgi:uncharacterized membrane protein YfcA